MSATYGHGRLLPGDLGYNDTQYHIDQAAELEREAAAIARVRFEPAPAPDVAASDPRPMRVTCAYCNAEHPPLSDPHTWECCVTRLVWAAERLENARLRGALERAATGISDVQRTQDFEAVPWPVSFDLAGVLSGIRSSLEVER
jgi:hypothetical protein